MKTTYLRRAAIIIVALACLIFPANAKPIAKAVPIDPVLAKLLARHAKASFTPSAGHDKSGHRIEYQIEAGGMVGTMVEYDLPPSKSRVEFVLGPLRETTGDDGKTSWEQDSSGHVRTIQGTELSENRADLSFSLEHFDPIKDSKRAVVTLRPQRDPSTGDYVIDIQPKGGALQTVTLDAKTALVHKIIVHKSGIVGTIQVDGYRMVRGENLPSHLTISYAGIPLIVTATLKSAQRGMSFIPELFAPPRVAKDYIFLNPESSGETTFPFTFENNEIIVNVKVNGNPQRFILDSGAGTSFIMGKAAQELGLTTQGNLPAVGYGGSSLTGIATKTTMEIPGAIRVKNQLLYVIKDQSIAEALAAKAQVVGALGYDLFARFTVRIDYTAKTITLTEPDSYQAPTSTANLIFLPIQLGTKTPVISASVDGKALGQFLIDTGDSSAVHLFTKYATANGLMGRESDSGAQVMMGVGIGGAITQITTPGHTLKLGTFTIGDLTVATMLGKGITEISESAGGIGNGALSRFVVTFDYRHGAIMLERPAETPTPVPVVSSSSMQQSYFRTAAATFALPVPEPTQPHLTQAQLLEQHLKALGGKEALDAVTSTRVTAIAATGGTQGTITSVFAVPDKEYESDNFGMLTLAQGYDGHVAWRSDSNGAVRTLGDDEIRTQRNQIYIDTNSYLLPGRMGGSVVLRPNLEPVTGNYILDIVPEGGKPMTLFIDPHSFLIVKELQNDDDLVMTTTYSDYRSIDGVLFPFKQHISNGTPRYDIDLTVTKIENNVTIPNTLFEKPNQTRRFTFLTPGATSATIPFDLDDSEIAIDARINGQPLRVFLDSGAAGLALSKKLTDQLHLKAGGYLEARGYGGSTDFRPVQIQTFDVPGAVRLTDVTGVAISLPESLNSSLTKPVSGFVGYDLLAHFVVRLDYGKRQLTFIDANRFEPTKQDGIELPLDLNDDVPTISAQIDQLPAARFLLDTGDVTALRLYSPYVTANDLRTKYPKGIASAGGGIGGLSEAWRTRINSVTIAGQTLPGIPADFSLDPKGGASQLNAGSFGSQVLRRFVVTFDYPHARVFFAPYANTQTQFETRTSGIATVAQRDVRGHTHFIIAALDPGSPIALDGIAPGDEILRINNQDTSKLGITAVRSLLVPKKDQLSIPLTVLTRAGKKRDVSALIFDPLQ